MSATTRENEAGTTGKTGRTWYEEFYDGLEAKDLTVLDRMCTADTTFRMANHDVDEGREAVRTATGHFFTMIKSMRHDFVKVVEDGDSAYLEANVVYTRLDGSTVSIPVSTAIDRRNGLIAAQRVYIDLAPLFGAGPL